MWRLPFNVLGAFGLTLRAAPELAALERRATEQLGAAELLVVLGRVPEARALVAEEELEALDDDAFILRSNATTGLVVCAGRTVRAVGYAFFEFLQLHGFGFLHPLKPVVPEQLVLKSLNVVETPRWSFRGTHYHTQHPLELTNCLNGYDDLGQTEDRARWATALNAWEAYLDWLLAQKQNYVEWMLLADRRRHGKANFELSDERMARLQLLVSAAHARGLEVGVDVPLSLKQQHALTLLVDGDESQLRRRVRWLRRCGFDHLGTELGTTEFTRGLKAKEMVRLLNVLQEELGSQKLLVKNHCSSNQFADGFKDPRPGKEDRPLNFNFLNYFAEPRIVSMPHTVQSYSLMDDLAPTYGNRNFSDLRDWTAFLLKENRSVVFYPETAYWVNFDISVPLFLAPLYTLDRVEDGDTLDAMGRPMGQLNFESGWQYGYWLANAAQARVAWRRSSLRQTLQRLLSFSDRSEALAALLEDFATAQRRLLVRGEHRGGMTTAAPKTGLGSGTAMAYLQGSEGLSDLASMVARLLGEGAPQPDRLHFMELRKTSPRSHRLLRALLEGSATDVLNGSRLLEARRRWFKDELRPLLQETNATFAVLARRLEHFRSEAIEDLVVSAELLSLRASQVLALYEYVACESACDEFLRLSRGALGRAQLLVAQRAEHMGLERLKTKNVLEWREPVPTAYAYGYLWAAHTLFYWRRDQDMVERQLTDLCFRSINDPVELGLTGGGGPWAERAQSLVNSLLSNSLWHFKLSECLGPPVEPKHLETVVM